MKDFAQAFQGDVFVLKLPDKMKIDFDTPLPRKHGKLIVQEGEMSGHHHYLDTIERDPANPATSDDVNFDVLNKGSVAKYFKKNAPPTAELYNGTKVAEALVKQEILIRPDLIVALLKIENGPMRLYHQEHSSVLLPPGRYAVGRQIESVSGEERKVCD